MDQQKITVNVIDEHSATLNIKEEVVKKCAAFILTKELHPGAYSLSIINCSDEHIQELNSQYRGLNEATDVLTFSMGDDAHPEEPVELGDIFLSIDTIKRQAGKWQNTPEQEYLFMLIHGLLHLSGYEHEGPYNEEEEMFKKQQFYYEALLKEIKPVV